MDYEKHTARWDAAGDIGRLMEWKQWIDEIPYITWPSEWEVKAIPPFGGALIRYLIRNADTPEDARVSVYLDGYGMLAPLDQPYWEISPGDRAGDIARCYLNEIQDLLGFIETGLRYLEVSG